METNRTWPRWLWAAVPAPSVAAVLAGGLLPAATPPARTEAADPGPVVEVEVSRLKFVEIGLRIAPGTKVRWVNRDPVPHTVTSDTDVWDSPLVGPGATFERTFHEPGLYLYHCSPHPFMKGSVTVEELDLRQPLGSS